MDDRISQAIPYGTGTSDFQSSGLVCPEGLTHSWLLSGCALNAGDLFFISARSNDISGYDRDVILIIGSLAAAPHTLFEDALAAFYSL